MQSHKFTEQQAEQFIREQHTKYFDLLRSKAIQLGITAPRLPIVPSIAIVDDVFRACGQYRHDINQCTYSLPYCVYDGSGYYTTVAHEICHAFQLSLDHNAQSHGREFLFLVRLCELPNPEQQIYHQYPLATICTVAEELKEMRGGTSDTISFLKRRKSLKEIVAGRNK